MMDATKIDSVEEEVRAHLRGFAHTIPSFIMAYGFAPTLKRIAFLGNNE